MHNGSSRLPAIPTGRKSDKVGNNPNLFKKKGLWLHHEVFSSCNLHNVLVLGILKLKFNGLKRLLFSLYLRIIISTRLISLDCRSLMPKMDISLLRLYTIIVSWFLSIPFTKSIILPFKEHYKYTKYQWDRPVEKPSVYQQLRIFFGVFGYCLPCRISSR